MKQLKNNFSFLVITLSFFGLSFLFGGSIAFGYGYSYGYGYCGYGYGNSCPGNSDSKNDDGKHADTQNSNKQNSKDDGKISINKSTLFKSGVVTNKIKLNFKDLNNVDQFMISKSSKFKGTKWEKKADSRELSIDPTKKQTIYIKIKNSDGSETVKKVTYTPPKRLIADSKQKVAKGDILLQKGYKFTKNSQIALHFSKSDGSYYKPIYINTDAKGSFAVQYKVNKEPGTYKWYAFDPMTGKRSNTSTYTVK